jgi:trehalose 6-phosphate phosphatase
MSPELAEARRRLVALLAAPPPLLVVSDFDGTLAPIDPDPMGAVIEPGARRALRALARIAALRPNRLHVVVLSGRSALDVARRVRVGGMSYLGNHGMESGRLARRAAAERLAVATAEELLGHVEPARRLGRAVTEMLGEPSWLFVELKGPTVAFHYRAAPDPADARASILAALDRAEPGIPDHRFERFDGRRVVELRPAGTGAKGAALAELLARRRPGAVVVLGDDVSDAEALRVVRVARAEGRLAGLALGVHGGRETPAEISAAADLVLPSPRDAGRLLGALAAALGREGDPARPTGATGDR